MNMTTLLTVLSVWNLVVFLAYGLDKRLAIKGKRRIPEKNLLMMAFIMGGPGAMMGMEIFRHKTKHGKFKILVPLSIVLNFTLVFISYRII